jgi:hypothetical protein
MQIPNFDHNNVLPPHLGDPTVYGDLSPYHCTTLELCQKFSTSNDRIKILQNFILFREKMCSLGIVSGFQWLDGSFLENIEVIEGRSPRDLDVVTFYSGLSTEEEENLEECFPEFIYCELSKKKYLIDHYSVDYNYKPEATVEQTRYWIQLFTHNRLGVWKGILKISLNTPEDDQLALAYLKTVSL